MWFGYSFHEFHDFAFSLPFFRNVIFITEKLIIMRCLLVKNDQMTEEDQRRKRSYNNRLCISYYFTYQAVIE